MSPALVLVLRLSCNQGNCVRSVVQPENRRPDAIDDQHTMGTGLFGICSLARLESACMDGDSNANSGISEHYAMLRAMRSPRHSIECDGSFSGAAVGNGDQTAVNYRSQGERVQAAAVEAKSDFSFSCRVSVAGCGS